jgi:hypothetical protein
VAVKLHIFLTSLIMAQFGYFTLKRRTLSIHYIGGWIGSRNGQNMEAKEKNPDPSRNQRMVVQPRANQFTG